MESLVTLEGVSKWFGAERVLEAVDLVVPRGSVTALLGRIPKAGDRARAGPLRFEVHEVRGRRVRSVDMHVEAGEEEVA